MKDGTYEVTTPAVCGRFVIEKGKLISCAPVLATNFHFWKKLAVRIYEHSQEERDNQDHPGTRTRTRLTDE